MDLYPSVLSTVCPQCATEIPLERPIDEPSLLRNGDRLVWNDWELRRDKLYFQNRYLIEFPATTGKESEILVEELSSRAYIWLTSIPIALSGLFLARIIPEIHSTQIILLTAVSLLSLLPLAFIKSAILSDTERMLELIEAFWEEAAPKFHANGFDPVAIRIVAEVCRWEMARGTPLFRYGELLRQANLGESAIRVRGEFNPMTAEPRMLAPITARIYREGTFKTVDLVVRLADDLTHSALGTYPLAYADEVLRLFPRSVGDHEIRIRLRVLLCQRWFDAGWQPRSLNLLGKLYPHIGQAIASENEAGLWNLYTLLKRGKVHDWKSIGDVETVFELAGKEGELSQILLQEPDLLMVIRRPDGNSGRSLILCEEGLFFDKQKIANAKVDISTMTNRELYRKLRAWMDYYFETFQHYVAYYQQQEKAGYHDLIWKQRLQTCGKCRSVFLGVPGEAGIAVGEVA